MTARKPADATRQILLNLQRNRFSGEGQVSQQIITIPASAKVTFAGINPQNPHNGTCLRIYTTANNQLAVFTNVESFRDLSLVVEDVIEIVEDESSLKDDGETRASKRETKRSTVRRPAAV